MEYYAHKISDTDKQTLADHLNGTAQRAADFAIPELSEIAGTAGRLHDIGKYAQAFQDKLNGRHNNYSHAAPGAIEVMENADQSHCLLACMLAYCIAGHHTGLPDGGAKYDDPDSDTLCAVLNRKSRYTGDCGYSAYHDEVEIPKGDPAALQKLLTGGRKISKTDFAERYAFLTRYLYSCLTDADFLDTEQYYAPETDRSSRQDFVSAADAVSVRLSGFHAETPLQKARAVLQAQAFASANKSSGISILNMPTGSGKTLCSLRIAMQKLRASEGRLKRIIYVIPFTSIIEQTAAEFESLIGEHVTILQHHSNFSYEDIPEADTAKKMKLAAENWDAPVIVTTAVQFFESLYHYKSSHLRKLHNMADAVIVLDEIHMLPVRQLQPCLRALGYISEMLHSEILLLSATMPDLAAQFRRFVPDCPVHELITDRSAFSAFAKCRYHDLGETDFETVVQKASESQSSLIVVNRRADAREIYQMLSGNKYHLSTYMTPHDRSDAVQKIRDALKSGEQVTVVSTSLIEAGVDLDFETVFRELAGLDNILQSGGRCNREGKRSRGDVYIFRTDQKPQRDLQIRAALTAELMERYGDITAPECIREYYDLLYRHHDAKIEANSIANGVPLIDPGTGFINIEFRSYARDFAMIEGETVPVVINNCPETEALLERLRFGDRSVLRKLQQYSVSLRKYGELDKYLQDTVSEYAHTGVLVLNDPDCYDRETGLHMQNVQDCFFG